MARSRLVACPGFPVLSLRRPSARLWFGVRLIGTSAMAADCRIQARLLRRGQLIVRAKRLPGGGFAHSGEEVRAGLQLQHDDSEYIRDITRALWSASAGHGRHPHRAGCQSGRWQKPSPDRQAHAGSNPAAQRSPGAVRLEHARHAGWIPGPASPRFRHLPHEDQAQRGTDDKEKQVARSGYGLGCQPCPRRYCEPILWSRYIENLFSAAV